MKIAEIFQLGYGDRGKDNYGGKRHKYKYRGGRHYRRHDDDGLLVKVRIG